MCLETPDGGKNATRMTARVRVAPAPLGELPAAKLRVALAMGFRIGGLEHPRPPLSRWRLAAPCAI